MTTRQWFMGLTGIAAAAVMCVALGGCGKSDPTAGTGLEPPPPGEGPGEMDFCDFKSGPDDAPVKVVAFYPGRHEDTLAAVKKLLETFPGKVQVEVVDWRHKEGRTKRDTAGLTCAGITVNGKNAFEIEMDGKTEKVMFVRGMDGDWTEPHLVAAVKQELAATE